MHANNKTVDCQVELLPGAIGVGQEVIRALELEGFLLCHHSDSIRAPPP